MKENALNLSKMGIAFGHTEKFAFYSCQFSLVTPILQFHTQNRKLIRRLANSDQRAATDPRMLIKHSFARHRVERPG